MIRVAAPQGSAAVDRPAVLAALERAQPGDTIQFDAGQYVVGDIVRIATPRLTLRGHARGTTLRGCDPDTLEEAEGQFLRSFASPPPDFGQLNRCGMFELTGGHVTIRDLTFEYMRLGIVLGCCESERVIRPADGGYVIEGNTFRNSFNSIRGGLSSLDATVIRRNTFINTFHAVSLVGSNIHVLGNDISMPEPGLVPAMGHPGFAVAIGSLPPVAEGEPAHAAGHCDGNVITGNRIEGHTDGILLLADPGTVCRRNVVRDNSIAIGRVRFPPPWILAGIWPIADTADHTIVGVPISLFGRSGDSVAGRVESNEIAGNRIDGGEGVGIEIVRSSRNRIVNNTIVGIRRRDRFPGNTVGTGPEWETANGSGIWVSPGSSGNEIAGNTLDGVAAFAVFVEGDSNRIVVDDAVAVRDLGVDNQVVRSVGSSAARPLESGAVPVPTATAAALVRPNDLRIPAGAMVEGELRLELEAVAGEWYPRGPDGPRILTPVFAEAGVPPQVPGPLIRVTAGTPVRVSIRNTLERPIHVRGLIDRTSMPAQARPPALDFLPDFAFAEPLVIPPGETREARFTPTAGVSSFYYARTEPAPGELDPPTMVPGGIANEGAFMGALVVDPPGEAPDAEERILMITRWGSPDEPGSLGPSWKMMANGQSWPFTERLAYDVGDTVRWRVINASNIAHPMHLHGFYFTVDGVGDTQRDSVHRAGTRRQVVTEMMAEFSSLRLRWTPDRPGNWLFHCHLIRHSGELQRFEVERGPSGDDGMHGHPTAANAHDMAGMAGLIFGITVRSSGEEADPAPRRRIALWTGSRTGVYDGAPELGFVIQDGALPPEPDSTVVPGSTIVLTRGEPAEIVVHNRLDIPLSVHWHGLELRSLYDGVGHWSGAPGGVRPPVPPGDSQAVVIAAPRAGTFFYHTHGEAGHELAQGLYGAFLVLEPGEAWDREADRLFVLGSRGADIDAPPAVNGRVMPEAERFAPGRTYRLRFMHISPDEFKRVRLLRDGEVVRWRPRAKDGADLPDADRVEGAAAFGIGVGEAYDFEWTPDAEGVYLLEVRTSYYPSRGGSAVQRVAFGVGDVTDEALRRAAQGEVAAVALSPAQIAGYAGTFTGTLPEAVGGGEGIIAIWAEEDRLHSSVSVRGQPEAEVSYMVPLARDLFAPATWTDGLISRVSDDVRIRFVAPDSLDVERGGSPTRFVRQDPFVLAPAELRAFAGTYDGAGLPFTAEVTLDGGDLRLSLAGRPPWTLRPVSTNRFRITGDGLPPVLLVFEYENDTVTGLTVHQPGNPPMRATRR